MLNLIFNLEGRGVGVEIDGSLVESFITIDFKPFFKLFSIRYLLIFIIVY